MGRSGHPSLLLRCCAVGSGRAYGGAAGIRRFFRRRYVVGPGGKLRFAVCPAFPVAGDVGRRCRAGGPRRGRCDSARFRVRPEGGYDRTARLLPQREGARRSIFADGQFEKPRMRASLRSLLPVMLRPFMPVFILADFSSYALRTAGRFTIEPPSGSGQSRNPSRTSCSRMRTQSATGRRTPSTKRTGHPRLLSSI